MAMSQSDAMQQVADISAMRSRLERLFEYCVASDQVLHQSIARLFLACQSGIPHEYTVEILLRADFARVLDDMATEKRGYHQPQMRAAFAEALARLQAVEEEMLKDEGEA